MFQTLMQELESVAVGVLPNALMALGVLIAGWLVALVAAAVTRGILKRTSLDNRLAGWALGGEGQESPAVEAIAGRVVFWLVMLFTLVGFFSVLGLSAVTLPFSHFLEEIFIFLPRLLSAAVLALVAWVVAKGVRFAVSRGVSATSLDRKLRDELEPESDVPPLSKTLGDTAYWLVFLLFLPAILGALGLTGLLEPVNDLLSKVLAFLPNLLVAGLVLAIGWFVARVVQRVVTGLLAAMGVDGLAARVGLTKVLGESRLSQLLGLVVYVLVLVPVVIAALDALRLESVAVPATNMLQRLLAAVPQIFGAALILLLAYFVARLVGQLVARLVAGVGFDNLMARIGFVSAPGSDPARERRSPSDLLALLVVVVVMLFASIEALRMLEFEALAEILVRFTVFGGNVLLGMVILAVGLYLGQLAASAIAASGTSGAGLLAAVARAAILVLAGAMALRQAGLAEDIINLAFGLLLGALAVAAAIAFGFGGRELAARQLERWMGKLRKDDELGPRG